MQFLLSICSLCAFLSNVFDGVEDLYEKPFFLSCIPSHELMPCAMIKKCYLVGFPKSSL